MKVSSVIFQILRGGILDGKLAFCVGLSKDSPHISATDLISRVIKHPTGNDKLVMILGDLEQENGEVMNAFTKALRDLGYSVGVETHGDIFPGWFDNCNYLRVLLTPGSMWLRHNCTEIRCAVDSPADPEPALPTTCLSFIVAADNIRDAVAYTRSTQRTAKWAVLCDTKPGFAEVVYRAVTAEGDAKTTLRT